jgi:hypothetical protein
VSWVEHGTSRAGRWLRLRRVRIALWLAVIEGILVVAHVISWPIALIVAGVVVGLYFWAGHRIRPGPAREIAWIASVSQALVALVPVLVFLVGALALIAVTVLAIVALVVLFSDRR